MWKKMEILVSAVIRTGFDDFGLVDNSIWHNV